MDPHNKHYTGMKPNLKGWCATIRWADKALHSDFLHSVKGEALYSQCADNFADLRQRFESVLARLITWEKGYDKGQWCASGDLTRRVPSGTSK